MSLDTKALAITISLLTGGTFFVVGLFNLAFPGYGVELLEVAASFYPGYHGADGFGSVVVATLYGLVDGAVGGWLVAWLYNWFSSPAEGGA